MSQSIAEYYKTLGLDENATPADIKKAYFRLVRKYTPEKAPEAFQKIRQAYEALKDGSPVEEAPSLEMPNNPAAAYVAKVGIKRMNERDFAEAARVFDNAREIEPENPFILYHLALSQLHAGMPQKAAKNAEKLTRVMPDSRQGYATLANCLSVRGWYKKAYPVFQKAYDLGERSIEFLTDYAQNALDNGDKKRAVNISWEIVGQKKWNEQNIDCALHAFGYIVEYGDFSDQERRDRFWNDYEAFLRKNRLIINDLEMGLLPFAILPTDRKTLFADNRFYRQADDTLSRIEAFGNSEWGEYYEMAHNACLDAALKNDSRHLQEEWSLFPCFSPGVMAGGDQQLVRFSVLDAQLCAIKNQQAMRKEVPIIISDYPYLYKWHQSFIDLLHTGEAENHFRKLKWEFDKLSKKYGGDAYHEKYPEMQTAPNVISDEISTLQPYTRTTEKVGRNDPCPCGSGKKFKKCCMGNGKYD